MNMKIILIILIIDYINYYIDDINFNITNSRTIHHRAGALLPSVDGEYKFLQIYFLGNSEAEVNQRCAINRAAR